MLPLGALTAFASTSWTGGTTLKVIRGVTSDSQAVSDITIKEDSADKDAWDTADVACTVTAPTGVTFAGKPTIKVNGTAIGSGSITLAGDKSYFTYDVAGVDGTRDVVEISNIKVYVARTASGTTLSLTCEDPVDGTSTQSVDVAKIKDGIIFGITSAQKATEVTVGEDNQPVGQFTLTESTSDTVDADDTFSVTCPDGATFYESPSITVTSGTFAVKSAYGSLSTDRKTATWTVSSNSTTDITTMTVDACAINLASSVATGTDIKFSFATSNSDFAISPTPAKVAEAVSGDDISASADTAPTISKSTNQACGKVIIKEAKDSLITEDTITATLESTGVAFAATPSATPSGGIQIEDADGDNVTTAVSATKVEKTDVGSGVANKLNKASWKIGAQSTNDNGGSIEISGLVLNVDSTATTGSIRIKLEGAGLGSGSTAKHVTIAYIGTSSNYTVTASGSPAIKINVGDQAAGDITITELKAGTLAEGTSGIVLKIFGNTSDNEVLFSEKPTVSIVSGDIDLAASGTFNSNSDTYTLGIDSDSSKASVIKISGIKYDVNSKAVEGTVQVVVSNLSLIHI
jgi:hypothetical protein